MASQFFALQEALPDCFVQCIVPADVFSEGYYIAGGIEYGSSMCSAGFREYLLLVMHRLLCPEDGEAVYYKFVVNRGQRFEKFVDCHIAAQSARRSYYQIAICFFAWLICQLNADDVRIVWTVV